MLENNMERCDHRVSVFIKSTVIQSLLFAQWWYFGNVSALVLDTMWIFMYVLMGKMFEMYSYATFMALVCWLYTTSPWLMCAVIAADCMGFHITNLDIFHRDGFRFASVIYNRNKKCDFIFHNSDTQKAIGNTPCLLLYGPHGMFGAGLYSMVCSHNIQHRIGCPKYMNFRFAIFGNYFVYPLFRDALKGVGYISSEKTPLLRALRAGQTVGMILGGVDELMHMHHSGVQKLIVSSRNGAFKYAHELNVPIVCMYGEGEREQYRFYAPISANARIALFRRWRHAIVFFFTGRWGLPTIPHDAPLHVHVGRMLQPRDYATWQDMKAAYVCELKTITAQTNDKVLVL